MSKLCPNRFRSLGKDCETGAKVKCEPVPTFSVESAANAAKAQNATTTKKATGKLNDRSGTAANLMPDAFFRTQQMWATSMFNLDRTLDLRVAKGLLNNMAGRFSAFAFLFTLICLAESASWQDVDNLLLSAINIRSFPGCTALVLRVPASGPVEIHYRKAFGNFTYGDAGNTTNPPMTLDTLFDLASLTKGM